MALLDMIQRFTRGQGLAVPNTVVGNTDPQIVQLLEIANEEGEDLSRRGVWDAMVTENTFTLVASASQGAMNGTVVSASDYDYIINDTMWNRTTDLPILGPMDSRQYQKFQTNPVNGPYQRYQIRGKNLIIDPAPTDTDSCAFDYMSSSWCESSAAAGQQLWADDTDVGRLDEDLMRLGIKWRWLKTKGLDYAEDFLTYERRVLDAINRDGGNETLSLDGARAQAGIVIPTGSWNL